MVGFRCFIIILYLQLRFFQHYVYYVSMYVTLSISTGLHPNLDLQNSSKLHYRTTMHTEYGGVTLAKRRWQCQGTVCSNFFFVHAVVWLSGAAIYCQKLLFFVSPCTMSRMYLKVDFLHFLALRKFPTQQLTTKHVGFT